MATELYLLAATLVLALVQILAAGQARTRQYGTRWNLGPRDEPAAPLDPIAGRLVRAQANLFETLPLFSAAVLAAAVADRLGTLSLIGAHLYFWGRLIYVPLYVSGIPGPRSLVWIGSAFGLVLVIAGLLIG
jgi:uncharacterized MAPEG superfamily protein